MRRRLISAILLLLVIVALLGGGGALWIRQQLHDSLPQVDGTAELRGLSAPVSVTRDALGIPTVRGASRIDVARATGFLHAQDRFFEMDLARRRAAGELSELVGARALPLDEATRIHRFRDEAYRAVALLAPDDRAILEAYAAGVNAGLQALAARPFEYLLLRQPPQDWRPEDSLLVVLSMFITLQDGDGAYESTVATMHNVLPPEMVDFLSPPGSEWDAPVEGERLATPPIPGPDIYDLRTRRRGKPPVVLPPPKPEVVKLPTPKSQIPSGVLAVGSWFTPSSWALGIAAERSEATGSNNFAVSGTLTADGGALVANDMHLAVRVPNTWYRADLEWPDAAGGEPHRLIGLTLPGVPAVVTGSNTHIAWGFTNTYADWSDIVLLDVDPKDSERYRTPDGWRQIAHHDELIRVAGGRDVHEDVAWTVWGPVIDPDLTGRPRVLRWVAHSAERLATTVIPMERAETIEQAFDAANGLGAPGQNMLVADRSGRIGWTVYGSIPRRVGLDGVLPSSWADGSRRWDGWLDTRDYPRIIEPASGRLWSANARVVGGGKLRVLGDGGYEIGSRATIIRDRLLARDRFGVRDLLAIQLDTSATFLARWRDLALRTLTPAATSGHAEREEFRSVLETTWPGTAAPDSAAYRLTRMFREAAADRAIASVLAECYATDPTFDYKEIRRRDEPLWKLLNEQPVHLLDPQYASWKALLLDAIDAVIVDLHDISRGPLRDRVWSEYNRTEYRHPLSAGIPLSGRWLDMPYVPLAGDLYTPNVHWNNHAASVRMVVSPGHEDSGVMEMPTGQSGHPLSPFYANSHPAWVTGAPTPFLPGPAAHSLTLTPPADR